MRSSSPSDSALMSHAQLRAILESSYDAIITKTLDGRITSWNNSAERIFGYPAQEAIGQPMTMLIPPDRANEELEILARVERGRKFIISRRYESERIKNLSLFQ